ncbi:hypothetical protein TeGR_g11439 [Tetraparma gracilis]|uniref:Phytanoyl-CoA dioxygenase n=1 Tax=Tetraparma gracilis TaxID=2962635 RepID=A0ABQ6MB23_9STRA|nr:hypothetical protein TeGR_g11439 [Tetraparma gracilis]
MTDTLLPAATSLFDECFEKLSSNGHICAPPSPFPPPAPGCPLPCGTFPLGHGAAGGFNEIVRRSDGRYEQQHGLSAAPFTSPLLLSSPVLRETLGRIFLGKPFKLLSSSLVMSLPGAKDQQWHTDGPHIDERVMVGGVYTKALPAHCLNVFIPLVDVPLEKGPTEFKPNTQEFTKDTFRQMVGARARGELPPNQTPTLKVGDALLFDYRVLHRGRANVSAEPRPVMVLTYSNEWFDDIYNFPPPSKSLLKEGKAVEFVVGAEEDGSGLADLSLSGSLNALVYAAAPGAPVPSSVADLVEQFPDRVFVLGAERPSVTIGDSLFALSPLPPSAPAPPRVFLAATSSPVATPLPVLSCSSKKPKRQTYACPPGSRALTFMDPKAEGGGVGKLLGRRVGEGKGDGLGVPDGAVGVGVVEGKGVLFASGGEEWTLECSGDADVRRILKATTLNI